jgi:hypothetical protein
LGTRIDFEFLKQIIENLPEYKFTFVGELEINVFGKKDNLLEKLSRLQKLPNTVWIKPVAKEKIPEIIAGFNICLIPYDIKNKFNKYCYPMKIFEYFYMGKPVISTPIEELKQLSPCVTIVKNADEAKKAIEKIVKSGWPEKYKEEQKKLAINNSWEEKIEKISQILKNEKTNYRN